MAVIVNPKKLSEYTDSLNVPTDISNAQLYGTESGESKKVPVSYLFTYWLDKVPIIVNDKDTITNAELGMIIFDRSEMRFYICSYSKNNHTNWMLIPPSIPQINSINNRNRISVGDDRVEIGNCDYDSTPNAAFLLGNGIETPHNALVVDWNGNLTASGNITDGQGNTLADLPTKATLGDILVDGKVVLWDATNQCLVTATTEQLRNLLMWIGTETELRTLQQNDSLEEGKLYATLDNTYFS